MSMTSMTEPWAAIDDQGISRRCFAEAQLLLVEDELAHAELVVQTLGHITQRVRHVRNGTEALAALGAHSFDLILLDIGLPDVSGMTVLRWIHSQHIATPVIVVSKTDEVERVIEAMQLKAANYVVKSEGYVDKVVSAVAEVLDANRPRANAPAAEGSLQRLACGVFVGRTREMDVLRGGMAEAREGRGRLVLLAGEQGIGKTSLLQAAAAQATQEGLRPLWGRCHEGGEAPLCWPWTQLVRNYRFEKPDVVTDIDHQLEEVARLFADRAALGAADSIGARLDADQAQFHFLDSVTTLLKSAARYHPLVLLMDDLQWADAVSLSLLRFFVRDLSDTPVLLVATYTDEDLARGTVFADVVAHLRRQPSADYLPLRGLSQLEVQEQLAAIAGHPVPESLARIIFQRTEGTPLFVKEVVHLLIEEDLVYHDGQRWICRVRHEQMPVPDGVRGILDRRVAHASLECREVLLNPASILGREFALAVVERLSPNPGERFQAAVEEGVSAGLIAPVPGTQDHYRFCHALMREAIYEGLSPVIRRQQHRRAGQAIEDLFRLNLNAHLGQLAYHFYEAGPDSGAWKASEYALRAGDHASEQMAHEDAVHYYEMALQALELAAHDDCARRVEVLVTLSEGLWRSGAFERAREMALRAMEVARLLGDARLMARAALAYAGRLTAFGVVVCSETALRLLEEALAALGGAESGLRACLLARLAEELSLSDASERRHARGQLAVSLARQEGDPAVLATVLKNTYWALWEPLAIEQRRAVADEIVTLASQIGDRALVLEGRVFRLLVGLEAGDAAAVHRELDACDRLAQELRQPYHQWIVAMIRACLALVEGRWDEADELLPQALNLGQAAHNQNAALFFGVQLGHLLWVRGRTEDLEPLLTGLSATAPLLNHVVRCCLAAVHCEQGRTTDARNELERLAAHEFTDLPRDVTWIYSAAVLSEVCALLGDVPRARALYRELLPLAGQIVTLGPIVALGSVSYCLGELATTMEEWDAAMRHFEQALTTHQHLGAPQWIARTQVAYARMLSRRGQPADPERANSFLSVALDTARQLGMSALAETVRVLRGDLEEVSATKGSETKRPMSVATPEGIDRAAVADCAGWFRREGDFWTVGCAGQVVHIKHVVGLQHIAELLRHPGEPLPVTALAAAAGLPPGEDWPSRDIVAAENLRLTDSVDDDAVPDARAVGEYRRRLIDLRDQLAESHRQNDAATAAQVGQEIDFLTRQLGKSWGRWKESPEASRLRLRITKGIRSAVDRIRVYHPRLARHIALNIKTGFVCTYSPDPGNPIRWTF